MISMKTYHQDQRGFTLAEMAVVVLLIGIAMTMGLKILTATLQNTAISETRTKQEKIKLALIGHLRSNGRLPCPDKDAIPEGNEEAVCNANAAAGYGVVPWITLNLSRNDVLDGWGNFFTYRVANRRPGAVLKDWTTVANVTSFDIGELTAPSAALTVQELNAAGTALVSATAQAVVVLLSHGKNGLGAETSKGNNVTNPPAANAGEGTNNTAATATFVKRPITDSAAAFNGPFDDLVEFMTPQDLLQPLVSEGTLRACYGYCSSAISAVCTAGGGTCTCSSEGVAGTPVAPCTACGTCTKGNSGPGCAATGIPVGRTAINCP